MPTGGKLLIPITFTVLSSLKNIVETSKGEGMISFEMAVKELVKKGKVME